MDLRYLTYATADATFYDWSWNAALDDLPVAPTALCSPVDVSSSGPWRIYRTSLPLPPTGWKVHVSCRPQECEDVITRVVNVCLGMGISCKHLRSRALVATTQGKYADPVMAGKVVTAYPVDGEQLGHLIDALRRQLAGVRGARVLSDVPVPGAPVGIRYGAFLSALYVAADGSIRAGRRQGDDVVPDTRQPYSAMATDAEQPPVVVDLVQQSRAMEQERTVNVTQARLLHRSNAGGVYSALAADGRRVILKEARHDTGFDLGGADAVTRLRHEYRALCRLSGSGVAPEPIDYLTLPDSDFLVMTELAGCSVTRTTATRHPGVLPGADPLAYRQWLTTLTSRAGAQIVRMHALGVVHRDLNPSNVIDDGSHLWFIDFESCAIDGEAVATGIATALSSCGDDVSPQADLDALDRLEELLRNPSYALAARRPELAQELRRAGVQDTGGDRHPDERPAGGRDELRRRLLSGISAASSPQRCDRLFPGDIQTFLQSGGGLGLLHGAAGVLTTLRSLALPADPVWTSWLATQAEAASRGPWAAGLGDGVDGTALGLAQLGQHQAARQLSSRLTTRVDLTPWWSTGSGGRSVALAELALLLRQPELMSAAMAAADSAARLASAPDTPADYAPGLLRGWAGVALSLLRVAELASEHHPRAAATLREQALVCIDRERTVMVERGDAILAAWHGRLLPYLGTGCAAIGLAADAALPWVDDARRPELRTIVSGVVHALSLPVVACVGLLHGRSGLALCLRRLDADNPALQLHLDRLAWYEVPATGPGQPDDASFVLGEQNLRCSLDLGTGSAGVVAALSPTAAPLRTLLHLPSAGTAGERRMTKVDAPMTGVIQSR